jgi:Cu-processing system permease protein
MKGILIVSRYEFINFLRSKYIQLLSIIFLLTAVFISYFGSVGAGYKEFLGLLRTSGSLFNLILITFPLISLLMGVLSYTTDRSYMGLLLSQPISRFEVFMGKYIGVFLSLFISTLTGFGSAGIIISYYTGFEGLKGYLVVIIISVFLFLVFLSLSSFLSVILIQRSKALGVSFLIWAFFVIIYDLLAIGVSIIMGGNQVTPFTIFFLLLNPVDIARVLGFEMIGAESFLGPSGSYLLTKLGGENSSLFLGFLLILWIVIPLSIAFKIFKKQDV